MKTLTHDLVAAQGHSTAMLDPSQKTILVAQSQPSQAQLWRSVLESQGHTVILEDPHAGILNRVMSCLPDLLIVDMTTGQFNPYGLCRDCRTQFPGLPIVLTHQVNREIEPAERRWATYQGAVDVLSGLSSAEDALDALMRVYMSVGWQQPIDRRALSKAVERLGLSALLTTPPIPIELTPSHPPASSQIPSDPASPSQSPQTQPTHQGHTDPSPSDPAGPQPTKPPLTYRGHSGAPAADPSAEDPSANPPKPARPKRQIMYRGRMVEM
jgi:CheY-like chemotaxis protein